MQTTRTDLALEQTPDALPEGITLTRRGKEFAVTEIVIDSDAHGAAIGRQKGRYLTLEHLTPHTPADTLRAQTEELAAELRTLEGQKRRQRSLPQSCGSFCLCAVR